MAPCKSHVNLHVSSHLDVVSPGLQSQWHLIKRLPYRGLLDFYMFYIFNLK